MLSSAWKPVPFTAYLVQVGEEWEEEEEKEEEEKEEKMEGIFMNGRNEVFLPGSLVVGGHMPPERDNKENHDT